MKKKIRKKALWTAAAAAALILIAAAGAFVFAASGAEESLPEPLPHVEYRGRFPGVPDSAGVFSSEAPGVFCRDFAAGPEGDPWFTAASVRRTEDALIFEDLRLAGEDFAEIAAWSSTVTGGNIIRTLSGSWVNASGGRGTFSARGESWEMESPESSLSFSAAEVKKQEEKAAIEDISLPEYSGKFPYAPGKVKLTRIFSLPERRRIRTELVTRDWELFVAGNGGWLMTRSIAGDIPEIPGLVFDRLSEAGDPESDEIRRSAGWISKSPLLQGGDILHAIAGDGLECAFSATGIPGEPAEWRLSAYPGGRTVLWGGMKMELTECELTGRGGNVTGTVKADHIEFPFASGDMVLKTSGAEVDFRSNGTAAGRTQRAGAVLRRGGGEFILEDVSWVQTGEEIRELKGGKGSGSGISWREFTALPARGEYIFRELAAEINGSRIVTSRGVYSADTSGAEPVRKVVFSDSTGEIDGFTFVSTGGEMTIDGEGSISGKALRCSVTSPLVPGYEIRDAAVEFTLPGPGLPGNGSCRISGKVYDGAGLVAGIKAEYFPEEESWRGQCDFMVSAGSGLAAILLHDRESSGWIMPLPGSDEGAFPEIIFPGWKGLSIKGIGAFEHDSRDGTVIRMINAFCSGGGVVFENVRGEWRLEKPSAPGREDIFSAAFTGVDIPGCGGGNFSGRFLDGKWVPETFTVDFLGGKCDFVGLMDECWLVNFADVSGKELAEGFFGEEHGTGWDGFAFSGTGAYDPLRGRWVDLSLAGIPADGSGEIKTAVQRVAGKIIPDASSSFFEAFLRSCFVSRFTVEYSGGEETLETGLTARPAEPLDFVFSGDPEDPFTAPEENEPGFSGTIEAGIHLPLSSSGGILNN